MSVEPEVLFAIVLMGLGTFATRVSGLWLVRRLRPSRFLEAWLDQIPGAVFAALCAPMVFKAGPAGWAGAAATLVVSRLGGGFFPSIVAGVATVALARWAVSGL